MQGYFDHKSYIWESLWRLAHSAAEDVFLHNFRRAVVHAPMQALDTQIVVEIALTPCMGIARRLCKTCGNKIELRSKGCVNNFSSRNQGYPDYKFGIYGSGVGGDVACPVMCFCGQSLATASIPGRLCVTWCQAS